MAAAIAHGEPFLGRQTLQTPVLFLDKENGLYVYSERIKRFGIKPTPNMSFWGTWNTECEPQDPDYLGLIEYVKELQPFLVFDSLVAFHSGSEQDSSETRDYMDKFRKLAALGATVLVIHHTGKADSAKQYRGSSDIPASADTCWLLKSYKPLLKHLTLQHFKSREGLLENIDITLDGDNFVPMDTGFVDLNDPDFKTLITVIKDHPGSNQTQICEFLPHLTVSRIRKLLTVGEISKQLSITKGLKNASQYSVIQKTPEKQTS